MDLTFERFQETAATLHTRDDHDFYGENHVASAARTPIVRKKATLPDDEKIEKIASHFLEIMKTLGLDMTDDSLRGTPRRVAYMYVKEIFKGLNPENAPAVTVFENTYQYKRLVIERNIPLQSTCEHHFQPIYGVAHVAYIPNGKVVGLSKLNRIVDFYARRPQVQERLTVEIAQALRRALATNDVAVYIDAKHMCVQARGIQHHGASTVTAEYFGKFLNESTKNEFLRAIQQPLPH